jgi:hypothetical protein
MHVAVSEFARHVCGMDGANSTEMDPETPFPVIDLLPEQKEIEDLGGTMRLGAQAVELEEGTRARETYGEPVVHERHRHRYEVNNELRQRIIDGGLVMSGTFQDGRLVEVVELPEHPWFVASQFHPEFKSRPTPRPLARFHAACESANECGHADDRRIHARPRQSARWLTSRDLLLPAGRIDRRRIRFVQQALTSPLIDLFLELCALPSPSGSERAVADRVAAYLTDLGL